MAVGVYTFVGDTPWNNVFEWVIRLYLQYNNKLYNYEMNTNISVIQRYYRFKIEVMIEFLEILYSLTYSYLPIL